MNGRNCLLSFVLSLIVAATVSGQTAASPNPPNQEPPLAPAFNLTDLKGKKLELSALRGRVVVLNFWFTGCEPCVAEFPQLNAMVKEFKDVVFIAPTLDEVATLKPFLKKHKFKYHVVPNAGGLIVMTYRDGSGNVVFPTHIVIDRDGTIDTRVTGSSAVADVRKALVRLTNLQVEQTK